MCSLTLELRSPRSGRLKRRVGRLVNEAKDVDMHTEKKGQGYTQMEDGTWQKNEPERAELRMPNDLPQPMYCRYGVCMAHEPHMPWCKEFTPGEKALATPVAQRPEQDQPRAHNAGDAEAAPQERQANNLRHASDSSPDAACVLASAPGAASAFTAESSKTPNAAITGRLRSGA